MSQMNSASDTELPSSRGLLRSTAIAAAAAVLLLITVVLPAEYGADPTGVGRVLGLTRMGEIKMQLAKEAAADAAADSAGGTSAAVIAAAPQPPASVVAAVPSPATATSPVAKSEEVQVILRPGESNEVKLAMSKGARVSYQWSTDRGVVNYDTHADRKEPPAIKYHGYGKGQGKPSDEGVLVAAFDGMHGWFWRNRTSEVVTVTLRATGDFRELKRMQ